MAQSSPIPPAEIEQEQDFLSRVNQILQDISRTSQKVTEGIQSINEVLNPGSAAQVPQQQTPPMNAMVGNKTELLKAAGWVVGGAGAVYLLIKVLKKPKK